MGDDQRQHLELARDLANRFNHRYGETFVVRACHPRRRPGHGPAASGTQDVQVRPTRRWARCSCSTSPRRSAQSSGRRLRTANPRCATTQWPNRGWPTLLSILAAATDDKPEALAGNYSQYGPLKADAAEAVIELLQPLQQRFAELEADPETQRILATVAARRSHGGPQDDPREERWACRSGPAQARRGQLSDTNSWDSSSPLELAAHLGLAVHAATLGLLDAS